MTDPAVAIRTIRKNLRVSRRVVSRLLKEIAEQPHGSVERTDRVAIVCELLDSQCRMKSAEARAFRRLMHELEAHPPAWKSLRDPTPEELKLADWDQVDRRCEQEHGERSQAIRRRREALRRLLIRLDM